MRVSIAIYSLSHSKLDLLQRRKEMPQKRKVFLVFPEPLVLQKIKVLIEKRPPRLLDISYSTHELGMVGA